MPLMLESRKAFGTHQPCFVYQRSSHCTTLSIPRRLFTKPKNHQCSDRKLSAINTSRHDTIPRFPGRLASLATTQSCYSSHTTNRLSSAAAQSSSQSSIRPQLQQKYQPPTYGLLSKIPHTWVPYAELMRIEKPAGLYLFYFPYLFGILFAASTAQPTVSSVSLLATGIQFLAGTVIMRGAACTWNDVHDRKYDRLVARTCMRPVARGAVSPAQAYAFTAGQSVVGLALLGTMPLQVTYYSLPVIALLGLYPFAKRITNYPQVMLGFPVAWGIFMGSAALGIDPLAIWLEKCTQSGVVMALGCFYIANVAWTIIYDAVYAHQDVVDDIKAGVKSIAVKHQHSTKALLSGLAIAQTALLIMTGILADFGPVYYLGAVGAGVSLATMIRKVDLRRPSNCMWWFKNGSWFVGGSVAFGLFGQYLMIYDFDRDQKDDPKATKSLSQ